ncbi:MAG: DUF692 family multinuclear iron-containing protein [Candidatus Thiodiazotropha endolucinida]
MSQAIRVGIAVEYYTDHLGLCQEKFDFIEYGYHAATGVPQWVHDLRHNLGADLTLHPLDINLGGNDTLEPEWLDSIAQDSKSCGARALVTDVFFWYLGDRSSTWPRPPNFSDDAGECRRIAKSVAKTTRLPFRVENPPVEWMPDTPSLWSFLERASDDDGLYICMDLSHLIQFEWNVHRRMPVLPNDFPWHRVSEIHLSGYLAVRFGNEVFFIDEHAADIGALQYRLLDELLAMPGLPDEIDICLEMEPHDPQAIDAVCRKVKNQLGVITQ